MVGTATIFVQVASHGALVEKLMISPPDESLRIVHADIKDGTQLIVGYSDATTAVYSVNQLATLTPQQTIAAGENMQDEPGSAM
jgi:hypothetical protein